MIKSLLICYAHPDDESFGLGALIAKYVAEGVEVSLICATNGDVGTVSAEHLNGYKSVAELRLAELDCAAKVLGFKEVITFGYRDSGMMGSPDNQHPDSLWATPCETVAARVAEVIRRLRPQVIITFDPFGGYGHPDHIAIHKATLAAWETVKNDPEHPQKLYYAGFPRTPLKLFVGAMRLLGRDTRHFGTNHDMDLQAIADATLPVHTRVDTKDYSEIGQRAAACHASQISPAQTNRVAGLLMRVFAVDSGFTRVEPPPAPGESVERDLFAGVVG